MPKTEKSCTMKIGGMDCAEEVSILKREIGPLVGGGDRLNFDILNGKMLVAMDAGPVSAEAIRVAVARTGMSAEEWQADRRPEAADNRRPRTQAILTAASGVFIAVGMVMHVGIAGSVGAALEEGAGVPVPAMAAYAIAIALGGRFVVVKAWYAARRLRPDMNLLMTVAIVGAVIVGEC